MKIKKVHIDIVDIPLTRPYEVTYVRHDAVKNYIVTIKTDQFTGLGAGCPSVHVTGELIISDISTLQDGLSELLVNQDIRQIHVLIDLLSTHLLGKPAVLAAFDMALHDLFCKHLKIHISQYLGRRIKPLATSITIGIKSLKETLEEGKEYVDRGFKCIKLKIGTDYDSDLERYIKLRESTPSSILIRVDANQGFTTEELVKFIHATSHDPVEFFEQPLRQGDYDNMRQLPQSIVEACAGDEDCQSFEDAMVLSAVPRAYGIFNIKLMKSGGITEAKRIAEVALRRNIHLMWGCMDESRISISAALNIAYAFSNTKFIDLDGSFDLAKDVVSGGFILENGILYPDLNEYGLGVQLIN